MMYNFTTRQAQIIRSILLDAVDSKKHSPEVAEEMDLIRTAITNGYFQELSEEKI